MRTLLTALTAAFCMMMTASAGENGKPGSVTPVLAPDSKVMAIINGLGEGASACAIGFSLCRHLVPCLVSNPNGIKRLRSCHNVILRLAAGRSPTVTRRGPDASACRLISETVTLSRDRALCYQPTAEFNTTFPESVSTRQSVVSAPE